MKLEENHFMIGKKNSDVIVKSRCGIELSDMRLEIDFLSLSIFSFLETASIICSFSGLKLNHYNSNLGHRF